MLKNSMAGPQKVKQSCCVIQHSIHNCIPKRSEKICSHQNLDINVHSNITDISQKLETTPKVHQMMNG